MHKVSVIIPFFQYESGILSRALNSVKSQHIPTGWVVEVIVVDDASPRPARDEVQGIEFTEPFDLKVVSQENGGPGAARNCGLEVADTSATLIAFLDSDDVWCSNHLARAIQAHESGFEFYFTDNRRPGHHDSHVRSLFDPDTAQVFATLRTSNGIGEIPGDYLVGLIIKDFPTQASSVVYRRCIAPQLRFDTRLKAAGEDVLFFSSLALSANRSGFDTESYVECGGGLNMYFGNLSWDSPKFLAIKLDQLLAHRLIARMILLSPSHRKWNDGHIVQCRRNFAFHVLRNLAKHPARVPGVIARLFTQDVRAAFFLPPDILHVIRIALFGSAAEQLAESAGRECP